MAGGDGTFVGDTDSMSILVVVQVRGILGVTKWPIGSVCIHARRYQRKMPHKNWPEVAGSWFRSEDSMSILFVV